MGMIDALSLAHLQNFKNLLYETESDGVVSISELLKIIENEESKRTAKRIKTKKANNRHPVVAKAKQCPEENCKGAVVKYFRKDLNGDGVVIEKCNKCAKSWIADEVSNVCNS